MATERTICCCGASTWTKIIASIQIIASVFYSIAWVVLLNGFRETGTEKKIAQIAISFLPSFVVIIMAIVLLKGTIQKHVGCLRAWIIYEIALIACAIHLFSLIGHGRIFDLYYFIYIYILPIVVIALNIFAVVVVYIHINEIDEGVFDLYPKQPVTTALEGKICGGRPSTWTPVIAWILIVYIRTHDIDNISVAFLVFLFGCLMSTLMDFDMAKGDIVYTREILQVTNTTYLIGVIFIPDLFLDFISLRSILRHEDEIVLCVAVIIYHSLGTITAFILLNGTNQKRVGYLRVWLIYGGVPIAVSILSIFSESISLPIQANIIEYTVTSVQMALNVFDLLVVYIHRKEINEGVFDLQLKQPVTTVSERTILCVGASTWTPFIAWIQIIANTTNLIAAIFVLLAEYYTLYYDGHESTWASFAILIVFSLLGIIMAIILLKGTNQKRVGYLRAWIVYGCTAIAFSVMLIIAFAFATALVLIPIVFEVAFNIFSLVVIHIHIKEIIGGIFDLQPKQPVIILEPQSETIYLQ